MESESAGGSRYVMIIVNDFSRFKVSKFLKTAALESYIVTYIPPEQLSIHAIPTDYGGEFEREFQRKIDQSGI